MDPRRDRDEADGPNRWQDREAELFAIALGLAVTVGAAVPAGVGWKVGTSAVVFLGGLRIIGRNPPLLARSIASVVQWRVPRRVAIIAENLILLAAVGAAVFGLWASFGSGFFEPLGYVVAASVTSGVSLAEISARFVLGRYRLAYLRRATAWIGISLRSSIDATIGVAALAFVRAAVSSHFLQQSVTGWVIIGALTAAASRIKIPRPGGGSVGPGAVRGAFINVADGILSLGDAFDRSTWMLYEAPPRLTKVPLETMGLALLEQVKNARRVPTDERAKLIIYVQQEMGSNDDEKSRESMLWIALDLGWGAALRFVDQVAPSLSQ